MDLAERLSTHDYDTLTEAIDAVRRGARIERAVKDIDRIMKEEGL